MHHFKTPLIATAIIFFVAMVVGIGGMAMIFNSSAPGRTRDERAGMLGGGLGIATGIVAAPFWLIAAAKLGKERRAKLEADRKKKRR